MIKAVLPHGTLIGMAFVHGDPRISTPDCPFRPGDVVRESTCTLYSIIDGDEGSIDPSVETLIATGHARCKYPDIFKKSKARQKALTRAIAGLPNLSKADRAAIWAAYLERS